MSYITKEKNTMNKADKNRIFLDKDLFAFASTFNDVYFANDLNWKKIAVHFKHSTSNQRKIVVLLQDSDEGLFEASAMARTGAWQIDQIQVFDKDGGMASVPRSDMPTPANFDISIVRQIAPSEIIQSINVPVGTSIVGSWTSQIDASNRVDFIINSNNTFSFTQTGPSDGFGQTGTETGTYTYNSGTHLFAHNIITDTNGEWGLSDAGGTITLVLTNSGNTLELYVNGELGVTFARNNVSQSLTLGAGKTFNFNVGYKVRIWNETLAAYHDSTIYTISSVQGDVIVLDQNILNYAGKTLRIKFPSYADASAEQKGIFQFIGTLF